MEGQKKYEFSDGAESCVYFGPESEDKALLSAVQGSCIHFLVPESYPGDVVDLVRTTLCGFVENRGSCR